MKFELEKLSKIDRSGAQNILDRGGAVVGLEANWPEGLRFFSDGGRVPPDGWVRFYVLHDPAEPMHQLSEAIRLGGEYIDAEGVLFTANQLHTIAYVTYSRQKDEAKCFSVAIPIKPKHKGKPAPAHLWDCPSHDGVKMRRRTWPLGGCSWEWRGGNIYLSKAAPRVCAEDIVRQGHKDDWEILKNGEWVSPKGWMEEKNEV